MKDIKRIRQDFHSVAWVMPQGLDLRVPWGVGESKNCFSEIQPDLVCEFLTSMAHAKTHFLGSPPPGALGRGQKVKYHKISITKSISTIFKPNFVCLLTNERYKKYQTGFSFHRLGHAPGVGLRGTMGGWGVKKAFFRKSTRFGVLVTNMNGTCNSTIFWVPASWGLGEGPKGQISLNLNYKVNFKDF